MSSGGVALLSSLPISIPQAYPGPSSPSRPSTPRGRRSSAKTTHLSSSAYSRSPPPALQHRPSQSDTFQAHHHLPPTSETLIPSNPILFLPPLLSPLPEHVPPHSPSHVGPSYEDLAEFATRLPDIDPGSLDLHQALHRFRPLAGGYAMDAYPEAFNWSELHLPKDVDREWYCVVFRSRRKPSSSSLSLYAADREAHEEAVRNGGLVMYWFGVPDADGNNLATCIWQSRRHAIKAISGPKHLKAMKEAEGAYEKYNLERWVLKKERGYSGLSLSKWQGGDVGW